MSNYLPKKLNNGNVQVPGKTQTIENDSKREK